MVQKQLKKCRNVEQKEKLQRLLNRMVSSVSISSLGGTGREDVSPELCLSADTGHPFCTDTAGTGTEKTAEAEREGAVFEKTTEGIGQAGKETFLPKEM